MAYWNGAIPVVPTPVAVPNEVQVAFTAVVVSRTVSNLNVILFTSTQLALVPDVTVYMPATLTAAGLATGALLKL